MFWGGLRGALVMALALSLPNDFPQREELINMTFGVVLFTLLVPGLTMEPLVKLLGMSPQSENWRTYLKYKANIMALRQELQAVTKLKDEGRISERSCELWKENLQAQILGLGQKMDALQLSDQIIDSLQDRQAILHLLENRREFIKSLVHDGHLSHDAVSDLNIIVDAQIEELEKRSDEDIKLELERSRSQAEASIAEASTVKVSLESEKLEPEKEAG